MADKVVVLRAGVIEQVGSPLELYHEPRNRFVAGFIGSPKMNFIGGEFAKKHGAYEVGIRPEHFAANPAGGDIRGTVTSAEHLGSDTFLRVEVEGIGELISRSPGDVSVTYGDEVGLTPTGKIYQFDEKGLVL